MRVLIFYDFFPPAYKAGGIVRSLTYLVQNFGEQFQFFILTSNRDLGDSEPITSIESDAWQSFEDKAQIIYCDSSHISLTWLKKTLKHIQPDCIYINGIYSLKFNLLPLILRKFSHRIPTIVAPRGMLQQGALVVKSFKKKLYLTALKMFRLHEQVHWHATDQQEVEDIRQVMGKKAEVLLALDTPDLRRTELSPLTKEAGSLSVVTISLITAKKNICRLLNDLQHFPFPITYDIYGPVKDLEYWKQCQEFIKQLPDHIQVQHLGDVKPEEVTAVLRKYHFFVLPTLGENFGHAIYEALNAGRPVIISKRTPWKGLKEKNAGWDFPLEESESLTDILKYCVQMDQNTYDGLCEGAQKVARNYVKEADFLAQYQKLFHF